MLLKSDGLVLSIARLQEVQRRSLLHQCNKLWVYSTVVNTASIKEVRNRLFYQLAMRKFARKISAPVYHQFVENWVQKKITLIIMNFMYFQYDGIGFKKKIHIILYFKLCFLFSSWQFLFFLSRSSCNQTLITYLGLSTSVKVRSPKF